MTASGIFCHDTDETQFSITDSLYIQRVESFTTHVNMLVHFRCYDGDLRPIHVSQDIREASCVIKLCFDAALAGFISGKSDKLRCVVTAGPDLV